MVIIVNPTPTQKMAIEESGKNIIVSAGAGSGKTAVLSERVLKKAKEGIPVDHLLILTFTKAAAAEMKKRIRDKLKKQGLVEQLNKIDNSYITTFDSFSLSIVKKYHYLLNVRKNINIIDSNILDLKIKEYLDIIMEEKYKEKNDNFVKLINDFCVKDDIELKNLILNINQRLNMKYDKKEYLDKYINDFYNEEKINSEIIKYEEYIKDKINDVRLLLDKLSEIVETDYISKVISLCKDLFISQSYLEIKENIENLRLPNLPKGSGEDASKIKKDITAILKEIKELTKKEDSNNLKKTIYSTKPYLIEIIDIIKKIDKKIDNYKYLNDLYDFVDISKMAIKIVKENDNIKEEIKNFFHEIMVDEYQDTSDLQEEFINLISNNNLYMVGDIKQSIYRFRNANPNIFRNKYNNYAKGNNGIKIDLLKNFRSREEVLNNVNLIFDYVMSDDFGGADYKESHRMVFGNTSYNEDGRTNQNNDFLVYQYNYDDIKDFEKSEIEAFVIANDIMERINNHYQIFDKDEHKLRDIKYSDFCILVDRGNDFELFKKIFLYKKIPLSIHKDEYLTNSVIFSIIKSIFNLLSLLTTNNNKKEIEYAFLSIGRSFLFNYPDSYLFDIIRNDNYEETEIFKIVRGIIVNIEEKTITDILGEVIEEFDFYNKLRKISGIKDNYVKIDYLYNLSDTLNQMGYNYQDFVLFIDNIFENNNEIRFSLNKEENNSVKIMTIHKSKGLEYYICYFPLLYKEFNKGELKDKINYSDSYGVITPYYDNGISNNFLFDLYKKDYISEEISEKIRLFYVALTRAKEKMIFILPFKEKEEDYDKDGFVLQSIRRKYNSFLDIMYSIISKIKPYIKDIDLNLLGLTKDYNIINSRNLFDNMSIVNDQIKITDYPKYNKKVKEKRHFSKSSTHLIYQKQKDIMEFGSKIHYYLESLDLKNPNLDNIDDYFKEKIEAFLNCDLLKNIKNAKIYQEYEFIDDNLEERHGIIDLMLEYSDHVDIIDYKLKNIDDDAYLLQLGGYRDYIKKIVNKDVYIYLYSLIDAKYQKL